MKNVDDDDGNDDQMTPQSAKNWLCFSFEHCYSANALEKFSVWLVNICCEKSSSMFYVYHLLKQKKSSLSHSVFNTFIQSIFKL